MSRRIFLPGASLIIILALLSGCGGGSSSKNNLAGGSGTTAANSVALTVGPGPSDMTNPAGGYANILFTSVSLCQPGTSNCATIDHVLVDTGSSGLRVLASELPSGFTLPDAAAGSGTLYECLPFVASYAWGKVVTADLNMAGEKASSLPVHLISSATAPSTCSGTVAVSGSTPVGTVNDLGAKGILGVGNFGSDCGSYCTTVQKFDFYFGCTSSSASSCTQTATALTKQVANPVQRFSTDNNGSVIQLASVPAGGAASASGTLFFGIGTQANNTPPAGLTVLDLDSSGNFGTTFQTTSYPNSFTDTGSNGLFFGTYDASTKKASTGITTCNLGTATNPSYFYCPSSELSESATLTGAANPNTKKSISFNIGNASTLSNYALSDLAATNSDGTSFDWGLPFFYGRTLYIGLQGTSSSLGSNLYVAF